MNIKITADSTCDLSEALLRQWNISLIPMHILMGEESYLDGVTIHPADVFTHAQNGGKMPKSAAPNLVEYTDFLAPFARDYVGKYITDQLANREDIDRSMVFISSTQAKPGCMEAIKAGLRQYGNFENVYETDIGTTIGGYSGPGTIGIVFARKQ